VPVSLVASVGAGKFLGSWQVISGTWKVSETSDGKRWLECVTAGTVAMLQANAFGTPTFTMLKHSATSESYVGFLMQQKVAVTDATQNGYVIQLRGSLRVNLSRITGGVVAADDFYTATGYVAVDTPYQITPNRRPSDCRFTAYIKGGTFTTQTLIDATGGGGSNPTAADATYTTNAWMILTFLAGDKLLLFDPRDPRVGLLWYQGVLNPMNGELP
jgi:hypothetical protein